MRSKLKMEQDLLEEKEKYKDIKVKVAKGNESIR